MSHFRHPSGLIRRWGLPGLVVLAIGLLSIVAFVMFSDEALLTEEEAFGNEAKPNPALRPDIEFPESVRTFDLSLNLFVDRFCRVCMDARYSDLRLMQSTRMGDPIEVKRFESMFNALKSVKILSLDEIPNVPGVEEGSVWVMHAEYTLEDYAHRSGAKIRDVRMAIAKEEGDWRIGPVPEELLAQLQAYRARQAAEAGDEVSSDIMSEESGLPVEPKASANRGARIGD